MPILTPLKITLYDPKTNEVKKEFSRSFVPWRILKKAIQLSKTLANLDQTDITEADVDAIAGLVVDVFGDQFTVAELNDGADLSEMMTVLQAIIAKAEGMVPNPPPRGS
jgi:23S rRNA G2069 N7-methylase RlmK/C1962 C5-methylase RlmI